MNIRTALCRYLCSNSRSRHRYRYGISDSNQGASAKSLYLDQIAIGMLNNFINFPDRKWEGRIDKHSLRGVPDIILVRQGSGQFAGLEVNPGKLIAAPVNYHMDF